MDSKLSKRNIKTDDSVGHKSLNKEKTKDQLDEEYERKCDAPYNYPVKMDKWVVLHIFIIFLIILFVVKCMPYYLLEESD